MILQTQACTLLRATRLGIATWVARMSHAFRQGQPGAPHTSGSKTGATILLIYSEAS